MRCSSLLRNNKKIHELRVYRMNPEFFPKYIQLSNELLHLRTAHSKLLGFWLTELGGQNEAVHIWEYDSLMHRKAVRDALGKDKDWMEKYVANVRPCWQFQTNSVISLTIDEEAVQRGDSPNFYRLDIGPLPTTGESTPAEGTKCLGKFVELCGERVGSVGTLKCASSLDDLVPSSATGTHSRIMFPAPWAKKLGCLWY